MQGSNGNEPDIDPIARLLRRAGRRPVPPPDTVARIRAQVHAEWKAGVARRSQQRWLAMAASVALLAAGTWWTLSLRDRLPAAIVARIERGNPRLHIDGAARSTQTGANDIMLGDRIETPADRGIVLKTIPATADGAAITLRLAAASSVRWEAAGQVRLLRGGLYVDTGEPHARAPAFAIDAGDSHVEHIGTQFMTTLDGEQVNVAVRDGIVRVSASGETATFERGQQARVLRAADGRSTIDRVAVDPAGAAWGWADALAPRVLIEGETLLAVLQQMAREGGIALRFESAAVQSETGTTLLHGPALELPPLQALQAVLATTSFRLEPQPDGSQLLVRMH